MSLSPGPWPSLPTPGYSSIFSISIVVSCLVQWPPSPEAACFLSLLQSHPFDLGLISPSGQARVPPIGLRDKLPDE